MVEATDEDLVIEIGRLHVKIMELETYIAKINQIVPGDKCDYLPDRIIDTLKKKPAKLIEGQTYITGKDEKVVFAGMNLRGEAIVHYCREPDTTQSSWVEDPNNLRLYSFSPS